MAKSFSLLFFFCFCLKEISRFAATLCFFFPFSSEAVNLIAGMTDANKMADKLVKTAMARGTTDKSEHTHTRARTVRARGWAALAIFFYFFVFFLFNSSLISFHFLVLLSAFDALCVSVSAMVVRLQK